MAKQQHQKHPADQFSDEEMEQVKRYGQALGGNPTPFDKEVERHLEDMGSHEAHEANYQKMRAAQTGGSGLGPSEMERTKAQQTEALQQQSATQSAQQAAQAQAQQAPVPAPPAPSGPVGTTAPYPAQAGEKSQPEAPGAQPPPPGSQPAPAGPEEGVESPGQ